jgi:hypothetical protein
MTASTASRPRLFIGSSTEGKELGEELQALLDPHTQPTVWDQDVFGLGGQTLASLVAAAGSFSFAAFVLTDDDEVVVRGETHRTARDNLFFEAGLFLGTLGPGRVFLLAPDGVDLKLPSDLAGVTIGTWRGRDDSNLRAALSPAALEIRHAIEAAGPLDSPSAPSVSGDLLRFTRGGLRDLVTGAAGLTVRVSDQEHLTTWTRNLLRMLLELFEDRGASDVYAAWLRPGEDPRELAVAESRNLPEEYKHHPFRLGEGLAGRVWETGQAAATSRLRHHPWWEVREGCENQAYLCVAVGKPGGRGGVLAVGSDAGFEVRDGDLQTLELFAGLLALATVQAPSSAEQILRLRLEALDSTLSSRRGRDEVEQTTLDLYNSYLRAARALRSEDELLAGVPEAPEEGGLRVSGVRVLVGQIVAALDT